jgi:hypothetical protein
MGQLATEAHSADITGTSPAVVRAEVSEQSTSLPGAEQSAADTIAFGSELAEAQGLDVSVETKTCPQCGGALLWTDFKDGRYIHGWACDNHRAMNSSERSEKREAKRGHKKGSQISSNDVF